MRLKHKISLLSLGILALVSIAITLAAVLTINQLLGELKENSMRSEMTRIIRGLKRMQRSLRPGDVDERGIHSENARRVLFAFFSTYPGQAGKLMVRTHAGAFLYPPGHVAAGDKMRVMSAGAGKTRAGFARCSSNNKSYLFVYEYFPPWKWTVILATGESEVFKRRDAFLRFVLILLAAGLVCGGGLSVLMARSIANPLARLAEATSDFTPGMSDGALPEGSSTDEVNDLTLAFKKMTGRLQAAYDAIEAQTSELTAANEQLTQEVAQRKRAQQELALLNRELEQVVASRTWDLESKAAELEEANKKLLRQDALKSSFLSSISHEFRTPLTSILGFVKLIKKDYLKIFQNADATAADCSNKVIRIRDNLDVIYAESERLSRLINDFLDFAKIEAGRLEWHDGNVALGDAVLQAVSALKGAAGDKDGVDLQLELPENLPELWIDPDRFKQLLLNLLSNALKYTETGWIKISARYVTHTIQLCIADSGRGVPQEELSQVFEKFHQVQTLDTLPLQPKGTGLGLSICREIVEHYHGLIWMESSLGRGSAVYLEFPLHE